MKFARPLAGVLTCLIASAGLAETSHERTKAIPVKSEDGKGTLQTLTADGEGRILALVAPPRNFAGPSGDGFGEVHVLSPEGETQDIWKVDFHAHSINVGPKGNVYVAGAGRIAKFSPSGEKLADTELQHIAELMKDTGKFRAKAEAQLKAQQESIARTVKQFRDRLALLEEKDAEDLTELEKRQLEQYKQMVQTYDQIEKQYAEQSVESVMQQLTSRLRIVNGVAVSEKDVFVATGEAEGYGYSVWRMNPDLTGAEQVIKGLSGCCGQMDIQTDGGDILVAENTRHRFARYSRDGKPLGAWGKRGTAGEPDCFGGCCNPMNLCAAGAVIYTAESEGIIKSFTAGGEFLAEVGKTKLSGGCKNVAVAASPDGKRVYMCDQPGSQVIVLEKKAAGDDQEK